MTTAGDPAGIPRGLSTYLVSLAGIALVLVLWVGVLAAGQPWTPVVVPVTALVCTAHACVVWASDRAEDTQSFDAADIGFVVAVVLLPLPVALLVTVVAGLVTVLVEFRGAPERLAFNAAATVLQAAASGGVVWLLDPAERWLPLAAAGAWFLVDQLLAHPLVMGAVALADGRRPRWRELVLRRTVPTWAVALSTGLLATGAGHAAAAAGDTVVWWVSGVLVAFAVVSRSRLGAKEEVQRLRRVVQVATAPATGRGPSQVLTALDDALYEVAGVRGVSVAATSDGPAVDHLVQPLPSVTGADVRRLVVARPLETGPVYARRQDAVRELLAAGADAFVMAESASRLRHDAQHDSLTGLLNREGFLDQAAAELSRAARSRSSAVLVYVDLDGFKAVNDTLGHEAGDQALRRVGAELRDLVRPHDLVCRLAGDEFALLLVDLPGSAHGAGVVVRLRERLAAGWPLPAAPDLSLSGSVGTASFPDDAAELPALLRRADARMYADKRSRRA